ncbi:Isochorismatase domain-containing protein 2A,Isochorismatase domain-containing protein 2,Isochorismatase domain-containing protein 1 [Mytilus coruscus]|uniref:Isochorismatase domain-containing protein 2A,Isochorismatase domain-containing protein 2,Isochorismatase domain-containing protein 1 n=1 Tax=Mytilus coruscus TaxID=42192 RepID=A0A6J7ZWT5_MYTCO|nr:Isochorismatase domain-containing protein 2A,Isochorismatase domain-containing protein 2,Isochorismatase domain-containing protein 1 [Mytilus coruscus]
MATRRLGNLCADKTVFFLCDMQERFRNATKYFPEITEVASRLYPKGLGNTVTELDISHAAGTFAKTKFSMVLPEVETQLEGLCSNDVQHIVLFGIETHVCVQQTVIDLLNKNNEVHIVADACSSRSQTDRVFALERFRHMGATVTTSEAVLLQLIGDTNHPQFKAIQNLIMKSAPDTGLVKL